MPMRAIALKVLLLLLAVVMASACPYATMSATSGAQLPPEHVQVDTAGINVAAGAVTNRRLKQAPTNVTTYQEALKTLIKDFEAVIGRCQFSLEGMKYNDNSGQNILVNSTGVFFPAATWLRSFFHDAGTFVKQPSKGGPKGGPNGSLAVGCASNNCGITQGERAATPSPKDATCRNGEPATSGFSDGLSYCCPEPTQCLAHGQSANNGATPGLTIPVCLDGSTATVELCRRENDNLLPTVQFFRGRQLNPAFMWTDQKGTLQPLSFADILATAAIVSVRQCSGKALNITHTYGRKDATVADDHPLPSPGGVIEDRHNSIFQQMGLNKIDMVTMVTGSHAIGGFRALSSPSLTTCPYVPFDCTPAGQIKDAPFDNGVFKVACNGVNGVTMGTCDWNKRCSNTTADETGNGCPFTEKVRQAYAACNPGSTAYPTPGLVSDIYLCQQSTSTRQRMVQYANDQSFFFKAYADGFAKLASLGYKDSDLSVLAL